MALPTLRRIFAEHQHFGSDKWTSYFGAYETHFARYRVKPITLLEIGVQNGGSLEIWAKYFPKAKRILGCDIDEKCRQLTYDDPRIGVFVGNANSADTFEALIKDTPKFDIIIDDGSHFVEDVIRSFALYFPTLNEGGTYVVEDLHTSYWAPYGGGSDLTLSSMGLLKLLIDLASKGFWRNDDDDFNFLDAYAERYGVALHDQDINIEEICFSDSICVIRKGEATFHNRRHITGNEFHVVDYSEEKNLSGTQELVDRLDVNARLVQSTEIQREFVTTAPVALANKVELDRLEKSLAEFHRELAAARQETEHFKREFAATRQVIERFKRELAASREETEHFKQVFQDETAAIYASTSWRLTAPIRITARLFRKMRRVFRRILLPNN
ncbi:class I SAM-dependent methyltransferase [Rhizobium sp. LEGMi198b]